MVNMTSSQHTVTNVTSRNLSIAYTTKLTNANKNTEKNDEGTISISLLLSSSASKFSICSELPMCNPGVVEQDLIGDMTPTPPTLSRDAKERGGGVISKAFLTLRKIPMMD